jgi:hypothetical protein
MNDWTNVNAAVRWNNKKKLSGNLRIDKKNVTSFIVLTEPKQLPDGKVVEKLKISKKAEFYLLVFFNLVYPMHLSIVTSRERSASAERNDDLKPKLPLQRQRSKSEGDMIKEIHAMLTALTSNYK